MAAASYRQSSPIIGYMGHMPGAKFHVGSRTPRGASFTSSQRSQHFTSHSRAEQTQTIGAGNRDSTSVANYRFDNDGNPIQRDEPQTQRSHRSQTMLNASNVGGLGASPVFQIPVQFVPAADASSASLQIPVHPSMLNGLASNGQPRTGMSGSRSVHDIARNTDRLSIHDDEDEGRANKTARSASRASAGTKKRSKSLPKRTITPIDDREPWHDAALNGANGGWWSEGQALRNIRRHREGLGLPSRTLTGRTVGNQTERETDNEPQMAAAPRVSATPAVGYTGHLTELHRLQVGKNFTDAAKESRKLQQSYRESLNGSFMSTRSHSPGGQSRKQSRAARSTRRSQRSQR
ncbi:hypothetical protein M3Y98_00688900 [Aphelenchoides besseyi]|nr:hypothetical protein M3Y98_00688900 [Aphelenchoides besseyi]KAI6209013.1 hypothetical protein M3Y96_00176100 [Aphelenchoides besseyi]